MIFVVGCKRKLPTSTTVIITEKEREIVWLNERDNIELARLLQTSSDLGAALSVLPSHCMEVKLELSSEDATEGKCLEKCLGTHHAKVMIPEILQITVVVDSVVRLHHGWAAVALTRFFPPLTRLLSTLFYLVNHHQINSIKITRRNSLFYFFCAFIII